MGEFETQAVEDIGMYEYMRLAGLKGHAPRSFELFRAHRLHPCYAESARKRNCIVSVVVSYLLLIDCWNCGHIKREELIRELSSAMDSRDRRVRAFALWACLDLGISVEKCVPVMLEYIRRDEVLGRGESRICMRDRCVMWLSTLFRENVLEIDVDPAGKCDDEYYEEVASFWSKWYEGNKTHLKWNRDLRKFER